MSTLSDGFPWHYDDDDGVPVGPLPPAPDWSCPAGTCVCHPPSDQRETRVHRIRLYDQHNKPMIGARCRVFFNWVALNKAAEATGHLMEVEVPEGVRDILVEWAPAGMPDEPLYPFRRRYYVDMTTRRRDAARRRLHNLGFSSGRTLDDQVREFEWTYAPEETGNFEEVEHDVYSFHDDGLLPPVPPNTPVSEHKARELGGQTGETKAFLGQKDASAPATPPFRLPPPPGVQFPLIGAAASPHIGRLDLTLQMALLLEPAHVRPQNGHPRSAWREPRPPRNEQFVANARVQVFDPSLFTQVKVPVAEGISDTQGRVRLKVPSLVAGRDLVVEVHPDSHLLNPTGQPAGPLLTKHLGDEMEAVFKPERPAYLEELRKREAGATFRDRAQAEAARQAIQVRVNAAYEAAIPPVLLRPFKFAVAMSPQGIVDTQSPVFIQPIEPLDPSPPVSVIAQTALPPSIHLDWKPDWVRAPVRLFGWERERQHSPMFFNNVPRPAGLGGEPVLVVHQTATVEDMGAEVNGFITIVGADDLQSIHYLIDLDGHVVKLIDDHYEANHAGADSRWEQFSRVNERSIGIEMLHSDEVRGDGSGPRPRPFPLRQTDTLRRLVDDILAATRIVARRVVGHGEVETLAGTHVLGGRIASDPGRQFEWTTLRGLTFAPQPVPIPAPPVLGVSEADGRIMLAPSRGPNVSKVNIQNVKQRLFDIGYSVSETAVPRAQLTAAVDDGLLRALAAFQLRIFDLVERRQIQIPVQGRPNSGVVSNPGFIWIDFATAAALVHISDHI